MKYPPPQVMFIGKKWYVRGIDAVAYICREPTGAKSTSGRKTRGGELIHRRRLIAAEGYWYFLRAIYGLVLRQRGYILYTPPIFTRAGDSVPRSKLDVSIEHR